MSSQHLALLMTVVALLAAGCGKKETAPTTSDTHAEHVRAAEQAATESPATPAPVTPAASAPAPAAESGQGPRVLELTGDDRMKFNLTRLEAKAGESVRVVLRNVGMLPKEAMGHNVVFLKQGINVDEFAAAAIAAGPAKGYFPTERVDQTIAHTPLIGPKAKTETSFTVPNEPGEYVYLCTFPGHYAAGMRGVLVVN